ncbi:MAG TPA: formate dehydrogenase subunit delta [Steroidobacteraceae bacterium]|nr:formate dehydrogenase subunit delta [Steroidobacteraceae bacterium]
MDAEHLVHMVNDIADFFVPASGAQQAPAEVAAHLKRFWEPRMLKQITEVWRSGKGEFSAVGKAAIALLAAEAPAKG